jgi:hypothetical protein
VFLAHSLGGLVVQDALRLARSSPEEHIQRVGDCVAAIGFFGTPHHGSNLAAWAAYGASMTKILAQPNSNILGVLEPASEMLATIQSGFHQMLSVRAKRDKSIAITCFYEERFHSMLGEVRSSGPNPCLDRV